MGQLTPGATLIYEQVDGVTYARESGSLNRKIVGMTANAWTIQQEEEALWKEIREAAESNEALQRALEQCKILYYLHKENGNSKT